MESRREFSGSRKCEKCRQSEEVEMRQSDQLLCKSCHELEEVYRISEKIFQEARNDEIESGVNKEGDMYGVGDVSAMTVLDERNESDECLESFSDKEEELSQPSKDTDSIVITKSTDIEQRCQKCEKKVANGVKCTNCGKKYHWRCGGLTKENEKTKVIESNYWACMKCRSPVEECASCKAKKKEIKNLKLNNKELCKDLDKMKYDLRQCQERCTDLEDRLTREKKLRRRVEKDLEELQQSTCDSDCSTCYSDDDKQERHNSKRSEREKRNVDRKGGITRSFEKTNGGNGAERVAVSVPERQPMNAPARTRPQERKAHHEEIVSDNQEHDNTQDDETPVNPGLSMALEYLRKYQQDSNLDQREHEGCMDTHINEQQGIKSTNTPKAESKTQSSVSMGRARAGRGGVCYDFEKNGACLRQNCKYVHLNRFSPYPDLSNQRVKESRTMSTSLHEPSPRPNTRQSVYRPTNNRTRAGEGGKQKICFKFRDNGHCRFGLKCRYRHERVYQHYNQSNDRENRFGSTKPHVRSNVTSRNFSDVNAVNTSNNGFNYFLEDMKSIVSTLKDITETQRQFTALPPTQMQGYQHHQFMPLTNQGQQVWPVAVQQ